MKHIQNIYVKSKNFQKASTIQFNSIQFNPIHYDYQNQTAS